jgi:FMN phosphatase YigB (HAD superfamily)
MSQRIAFDLDETLGVPILDGATMIDWQVRPGALEVLATLRERFTLLLWSVAPRRYVEKALSFGLRAFFAEVFAWEDLPGSWKDVRRVAADWLIDDSPHHREAAAQAGIADRYLVIPAYGSPEDGPDPLAWAQLITATVYPQSS